MNDVVVSASPPLVVTRGLGRRLPVTQNRFEAIGGRSGAARAGAILARGHQMSESDPRCVKTLGPPWHEAFRYLLYPKERTTKCRTQSRASGHAHRTGLFDEPMS